MGIGSLIIFIAMILIAGATASVMLQVMSTMEEQARRTGEETIRDISSGLQVTHVSGYCNGTLITRLALFLTTSAGSNDIDLSYTYISVSDSTTQVILNYNSTCFSSSASSGLFGTLNMSNLTSTNFGIIVVRDIDNSCTSTNPIINNDDLVVLVIDAYDCFSGIGKRTEVNGRVIPEIGLNGIFGFITPSAYTNTIIDL